MYALTRQLSPATELPLTVVAAKEHLKVTGADEDGLITGLILAAAGAFELESKLPLMQATYLSVYPRFATVLPNLLAPIGAVSTVKYQPADGTAAVTLSAGDYTVGEFLNDTLEISADPLPATACRQDAVRVTYTAGFETADDVPRLYQQYLLLLVGHWYENRQSVAVGLNVTEVPGTCKMLMNLIRTPTL